jgi:hypothetical protein
MNVAIFTDNDFGKVNGVTTTLTAALDCAPAGLDLKVYTAAALPVEPADYLAVKSMAVPIPFCSAMDMFVPGLGVYLQRAREDRIDLIHLTTPGPIGLAAMHTAWRLQLPMVGSFHTDLAAYTAVLSGSRRLGVLMREYMRWVYGKCSRVLVPSEATRGLLIRKRLPIASRFIPSHRCDPSVTLCGARRERVGCLPGVDAGVFSRSHQTCIVYRAGTNPHEQSRSMMSETQGTPITSSDAFLQAVRRAKAEFLEMPGLRLTAAQAARLWSVDSTLCGQVLSALVESRFLAETSNARFIRASD